MSNPESVKRPEASATLPHPRQPRVYLQGREQAKHISACVQEGQNGRYVYPTGKLPWYLSSNEVMLSHLRTLVAPRSEVFFFMNGNPTAVCRYLGNAAQISLVGVS